ncbi:MAG: GNAT family N-acetyltransferase [Muribaculum sp.]|nr:GNAT family N-acetyltransferase [Muribaculaceae bacterium]MCM1081307.1 GNAT family N-acetyltransferase [Muribaculum sp.]
MASFYAEYLNDAPELFHVALDGDKIVGFCMGYYMDNDTQMQRFLQKNKIKIAWKTILLLLTFNRQTWNKAFGRLRHKPSNEDWKIINTKHEHIKKNKRGDLLSVCVLPEYRGKDYAQQLMESFLSAMKNSGKEICLLSVDANNKAARKYYERNGFELYRTRGCDGLTYIKPLNSNGTDNVSD